jgi:TP901 family phage tail tape measure protein
MSMDPDGSASFALVVGLSKFRKDLQEGEQIAQKSGDRIGAALGDSVDKAAAKGIASTGQRLAKMGSSLSTVGTNLTWGITAPLLAVGGMAAKAAIDFESAFAGVRKTVDATDAQFDQLEQGIRDMSKVMPESAAKIAGIAESAGALGIAVPNILGFTKVMIGLGSSTNISAEQAADSLARIANVTKMPQTEFDRMGSTIVDLGNKGASTEAEIVEMGSRLAAAGAIAGMSVPDILAIASAMASVGIEAEAGGSSMSQLIQAMQVAVATGSKDLDQFAKVAGMTGTQFAQAFKSDAAGALTSFIEGLGTMGDQAYTILDNLGLDGIRLLRTQLSLASANGILATSIQTANTAWEQNTALTNEVNTRNATFAAQWQMFKNKVVDVAITLGTALIPSLLKLMDAATPVLNFVVAAVDWFTNLPQPIQTTVLGILALAAALGPVLFIGGKLLGTVGSLITVFARLIPLIQAVGTSSMLANPYVLALIAALVATAIIIKNWETIKRWFSDFWGWIERAAQSAMDGVVNAFKAAINYLIRGWNALNFTIPSVTIPMVGTFGGQQIGVGKIPELGHGGTATRGGIATVGEIAGKREIYMPPGAQVRPLDKVGSDLGDGSRPSGDVHTTIELDGRVIARQVRPLLVDKSRRNGRNSTDYS